MVKISINKIFLGSYSDIKSRAKYKLTKAIDKTIKKCKRTYANEYYINKYATRELKLLVFDERIFICEIDMEFKRPIFKRKDRNDKNNYYFVDKELNLTNRQRVFVTDKIAFASKILEHYSYRTFIKSNNLSISPSTITNILKKTKFYYKPKIFNGVFEKIFVSIDGMALNTSEKKEERKFDDETGKTRKVKTAKESSTNAVIFTGNNYVHEFNKNDKNKRRKLENRTLLHFPKGLATKDIAYHLEYMIKRIYGKNVEKIIVLGDGAKDICNLPTWFSTPSERYIDSFHFTKRLRKFLALGWKKKINIVDYLKLSYVEFESKLISKRKDKYIDKNGGVLVNKLENNHDFQYLIKWFDNWKMGVLKKYRSPIEGIHGNYLSDVFKRKRKFCEHNRELLISLIFAKASNWEIADTHKKGFTSYLKFQKHRYTENWDLWKMSMYVDPHGVRTDSFSLHK